VVTTGVTGHDEYVEHGVNGLVVGWDDIHGTARVLDLLARDRRLLHHLRTGALATARAWPDWRQASQWMALALGRVLAEPGPPVASAGRRLVSDFSSVTADAQQAVWRLEIERELKDEMAAQRAIRYALATRGRLHRVRMLPARVKARLRALLPWG
jgi:hypothetical protein